MIRIDASAIRGRTISRAKRARLLAALVVCAGALLMTSIRPSAVQATMLQRIPIEEAARRASTVVVGRVVGTRVEESSTGVRTAVSLWVDESLKGTATGVITVYVPGGELPDGSRVFVDSMATFAPGEVCCVFVDSRGWILGGYQGKLQLEQPVLGSPVAAKSAALAGVKAALADHGTAPTAEPSPEPQPQQRSASSVLGVLPSIASVTPGSAPAGTHGQVALTGSGFGTATGTVGFALNLYGISHLASNRIVSWSDARIVCEVPVGSVAGSVISAGSGPVVVTRQDGSQSNPYDFQIPFGYGGQKWPKAQARYALNTGGVDSANRELLVDAGAAHWNSARSEFSFVDIGPTGAGATKDGSNVICWSDTVPLGVVALTYLYSNASGEIEECDLQFNDALPWGDGIAAATSDIQSITSHELGHWLGLLDQYTDADIDKVMYGYEVYGQRRELTVGDIAGIRWIYPGPSGALHGVVQDAAGSPVAGARVAIETCEPVSSSSDGSFLVTGTPVGTYQVACSSPGYTTRVFSATIVADETAETTVTLVPGEQMPIYRFFQRKNGSHFYTASAAERDRVVSRLFRSYTFEGTAYTLNRLDPTNSTPLYRFFNKKNGSHFYTASVAERDSVRSKLRATYSYEGTAYLVASSPTLATVPVYRFFNKRNRSHFYTTSSAEKNRVIREFSKTYAYEGRAFWVAP